MKEHKTSKKSSAKNSRPKRKRKSKKRFLLFVSLVLALGFGGYLFLNQDTETRDLFKSLTAIEEAKEPHVLIIRDDSSVVSSKEKKILKSIRAESEKQVATFYIIYNEKNQKEKDFVLSSYQVEKLPAVVLLTGEDKVAQIYYPPFDLEEIVLGIERLAEGVQNEGN